MSTSDESRKRNAGQPRQTTAPRDNVQPNRKNARLVAQATTDKNGDGVSKNTATGSGTSTSAAASTDPGPAGSAGAGTGTGTGTGSNTHTSARPVTSQATNTTTRASVPPPEHTSVLGPNATGVDSLLNRGHDPKTPVYKADTTTNSTPKSQSPWGAKAGAMASGKDFWLELRKQITSLKKGESLNKGG